MERVGSERGEKYFHNYESELRAKEMKFLKKVFCFEFKNFFTKPKRGLTFKKLLLIARVFLKCKPTWEVEKEKKIVAGLYMMVFKNEIIFFADTTVNINPNAEVLAEIAILSADEVLKFDIEPHIAMLSFSNFGSVRHELTNKVAKAAAIVRERRPEIEIDGEKKVMGGPVSAVKSRSNRYVVLTPGNIKKVDIARKLGKVFDMGVDSVDRVLPPGGVTVVETVGVEL